MQKNGKNISFDQSSKITSYLENCLQVLGLTIVDAHTTESGGSFELEGKVELIFSVDVYHHIKDRITYFSKETRYLKPDGAFIVIDRAEEKVES